MKITNVRIFKIKKRGSLLGYANVTLDDAFVVHGIKILEKDNTRFIAMPSRKVNGTQNKNLDWCQPINSETRKKFVDAILEKYEEIEN